MSARYIIKLLTLGDTNVGKTSVVLRFSDDKYNDNQLSTIGVDFRTKYMKLGENSVKVLIWDTAGQERFKNIAKQYYRGANGVLLIYDVCKRKSLEKIGFWLEELKTYNNIDELCIYLVGNKIDLEGKRVITKEEGQKYAEDNQINYFEVSAKSGEGIHDLFNDIIKGSIDKLNIDNKDQIFAQLDNKTKKRKKKWC
jgi:small GTP-binding protein